MTAVQEKLRTLINRLYDRTMEGKLVWNIEYGDIVCQTGNHRIYLKSSRDADGEPIEVVELRNLQDEIVDSFDDTDIPGNISNRVGIRTYFELMLALRNAARRSAVGADKALDDILRDLESDF